MPVAEASDIVFVPAERLVFCGFELVGAKVMPDYIPDNLIGGHCEIVASLIQSTVLIFVADVD